MRKFGSIKSRCEAYENDEDNEDNAQINVIFLPRKEETRRVIFTVMKVMTLTVGIIISLAISCRPAVWW